MDGMPGIETKNNLGPSIGLSITGNTITGSAGVAIWLLCNNGCTYGSTISGNTLSGNAGTGNFCNGMIQDVPRVQGVWKYEKAHTCGPTMSFTLLWNCACCSQCGF